MLETLTDVATIMAAVLALATFTAYSVLAPWWSTRSGLAYWVLQASLILFGGHYVAVALSGEAVPWRRLTVICLVGLALGWNLIAVTWKQWHYRHDDEEN